MSTRSGANFRESLDSRNIDSSTAVTEELIRAFSKEMFRGSNPQFTGLPKFRGASAEDPKEFFEKYQQTTARYSEADKFLGLRTALVEEALDWANVDIKKLVDDGSWAPVEKAFIERWYPSNQKMLNLRRLSELKYVPGDKPLGSYFEKYKLAYASVYPLEGEPAVKNLLEFFYSNLPDEAQAKLSLLVDLKSLKTISETQQYLKKYDEGIGKSATSTPIVNTKEILDVIGRTNAEYKRLNDELNKKMDKILSKEAPQTASIANLQPKERGYNRTNRRY